MQTTHDASQYPQSRWIAMAVLLFASFMNLLDVTIVNVALPSMQTSLAATPAQIEWVVAVYTLGFALGLLPFGRLGDHLGRRRVFLAGVVAFTFCSILCGIADSIGTLIAARALQGLAGSMMAPQTLAIAQVIFPPKERGAAFALFGLTASLAAVTGPLAGGLLIGADIFGLDWRPIFLVNIPVGLIAFAAGLRFIPSMPGHRATGIDFGGIALAALAVFLLVFPLIEGRGYGWPLWSFVMMAASVPAMLAFLRWQARQAALGRPQLMPAALLANRDFMLGTLVSTAFFSTIPGFFLVLAVFLQTGYGLTPLQSGLTSLPFSLGVLLASVVSGALGIRAPRLRILLGALAMALAMIWLRLVTVGAMLPGEAVRQADFIAPLLVAGLGMGSAIAPLYQLVLATVKGPEAGSASGSVQSVQQVGGALGVAIMGELFFSVIGRGLRADYPAALASALHYEIVVLLAVAACAFLLRAPPRHDMPPATAGG